MIQTISKIICRRDPKVNKNLCGIKGEKRMLWKLSIFSCFFFVFVHQNVLRWKSIYFQFDAHPFTSISGEKKSVFKEDCWEVISICARHTHIWLESNYIFSASAIQKMIQFSCAWKLKNLIYREKILHMPSSSSYMRVVIFKSV